MQTKTQLKPPKYTKDANPNQSKGTKEAKPDKAAFNKYPKTGKERWKARKMSRSKTPPQVLQTSHIPWL